MIKYVYQSKRLVSFDTALPPPTIVANQSYIDWTNKYKNHDQES